MPFMLAIKNFSGATLCFLISNLGQTSDHVSVCPKLIHTGLVYLAEWINIQYMQEI